MAQLQTEVVWVEMGEATAVTMSTQQQHQQEQRHQQTAKKKNPISQRWLSHSAIQNAFPDVQTYHVSDINGHITTCQRKCFYALMTLVWFICSGCFISPSHRCMISSLETHRQTVSQLSVFHSFHITNLPHIQRAQSNRLEKQRTNRIESSLVDSCQAVSIQTHPSPWRTVTASQHITIGLRFTVDGDRRKRTQSLWMDTVVV